MPNELVVKELYKFKRFFIKKIISKSGYHNSIILRDEISKTLEDYLKPESKGGKK